mmetsp:Transcript_65770/g.140714  ORF Transcript_65770/g.140714 Transcript_65770/m.140714 type:complete len:208 (-) Transcript_65770:401-1024(-)
MTAAHRTRERGCTCSVSSTKAPPAGAPPPLPGVALPAVRAAPRSLKRSACASRRTGSAPWNCSACAGSGRRRSSGPKRRVAPVRRRRMRTSSASALAKRRRRRCLMRRRMSSASASAWKMTTLSRLHPGRRPRLPGRQLRHRRPPWTKTGSTRAAPWTLRWPGASRRTGPRLWRSSRRGQRQQQPLLPALPPQSWRPPQKRPRPQRR